MSFILANWVMCLSFTIDSQVPFKVTSDPKAAASHVSSANTTDKGKEKKPNIHQWMWNEQEHFRSCDSQLTQLYWVCGCCSFPFHTLGLQLRFVFQTQKLFTFQPVADPLSAHAALCTSLLSMGRKSMIMTKTYICGPFVANTFFFFN